MVARKVEVGDHPVETTDERRVLGRGDGVGMLRVVR